MNKKIIFYLSMIVLGAAVMIKTGIIALGYNENITKWIENSTPFNPLFLTLGLSFLGGLLIFRYFYKFMDYYW
ncbi:MAG: hypothetical protein WC603_02325 [Candidatus Paceibacterota bacterium]